MADEIAPLAVPQSLTASIANGTNTGSGWHKLTFASILSGGGATVNGSGDLAFTATGAAGIAVGITAQVEVTTEGPASVALGYSWNGGSTVALTGAVVIPNDEPVPITAALQVPSLGTTLQLYILSTNATAPLNWTGGEVAIRYTLIFPADASAPDYSATPPMPVDPGGNTTTPPVVPGPGPGAPPNTGGTFPYTLVLPVFAWLPLAIGTLFNISSVPPWAGKTGEPNPTPPPLLTMTRTPPFPAYPT